MSTPKPAPDDPPPPLIERLTLRLPHLPAAVYGLRILHLTDLHIRRRRRRYRLLRDSIARLEHDVLAITGDIMDHDGDEPVAHEVLLELLHAAKPRLGRFGVHGNHDTQEFRRRMRHVPVTWLLNTAYTHPTLPLTLLGVECQETEHTAPRGDLVAALLEERRLLAGPAAAPPPTVQALAAPAPSTESRLRILLAHVPNWLPAAAEAHLGLVLSGHTHAGQLRAPGLHPFYNATAGWPTRYSGGVYQAGQTLGVISRGIGESYFDHLRLFCRPHALLITLEPAEGALPPASGVNCLRHW